MEPLKIEGGTAVITGAASGIGAGLARRAAALGMRLVLADIDGERLDELAQELDVEVLTATTDVRDPQALERLAQLTWEHYDGVDLLFNNAGVMSIGYSWEVSAERWKRDLAVNVHGVLNGLHGFVPRLLEAGKRAHIVNTASVGGFLPSPLMAPYSASKFAVVALTEALHGELQMLQVPVTVSLLAPGPVRSGIFDAPFGSSGDSPAARRLVEGMRQMLADNGLDPEVFADRVFTGIRAGEYWLLPQPEALDEPLRQRMQDILTRRKPTVPWT